MGLSDGIAPFEQFWLEMRLDNLLDNVLIPRVTKILRVALHLFVKDSFLMPFGPDLSLRGKLG